MINETKAIKIINKYLKFSQDSNILRHFPVSASQIYGDRQLCECLIDFLGDIYVSVGMDINYEDTVCGSELQAAITFLASCNKMNDYENDCYRFILNLVKELAQDYDVQYQHTEEFARWNLPEEIALEWIDAKGMIDVLQNGKCIPKETIDVLREITNAFISEFEKNDNPVWTHEAMKKSDFWNMQRLNAMKALDKMNE